MTQQSLLGQLSVEAVTLRGGDRVTCNIFMIVSDAAGDDFCALKLSLLTNKIALVSGDYWRFAAHSKESVNLGDVIESQRARP